MEIIKRIRVLILAASILAPWGLLAQKKEAQATCKSITVYNINYDDNKAGSQQKESFTNYDLTGNIIESIDYDKDGVVKEHILFEYNKEGQKTKETYLKANGNKDKVVEFVYVNGLKSEKTVYLGNGKIKSKKKYVYVQ